MKNSSSRLFSARLIALLLIASLCNVFVASLNINLCSQEAMSIVKKVEINNCKNSFFCACKLNSDFTLKVKFKLLANVKHITYNITSQLIKSKQLKLPFVQEVFINQNKTSNEHCLRSIKELSMAKKCLLITKKTYNYEHSLSLVKKYPTNIIVYLNYALKVKNKIIFCVNLPIKFYN